MAVEVIPALNEAAAGNKVVGELVSGQCAGMGERLTPLIGVRDGVEEVLAGVDRVVTDRRNEVASLDLQLLISHFPVELRNCQTVDSRAVQVWCFQACFGRQPGVCTVQQVDATTDVEVFLGGIGRFFSEQPELVQLVFVRTVRPCHRTVPAIAGVLEVPGIALNQATAQFIAIVFEMVSTIAIIENIGQTPRGRTVSTTSSTTATGRRTTGWI